MQTYYHIIYTYCNGCVCVCVCVCVCAPVGPSGVPVRRLFVRRHTPRRGLAA